MFGDVEAVLSKIRPNDLVLDVGGWACPFNRANWIIDAEPYDTKGAYEKIGMSKYQGGETEYFNKDTWIQRDICDKTSWPFEDKVFDFSICSHTLEDIRDPLYVCSELIRVSKRGYIEVPSRIWESCRGLENEDMVGLSHHRWLVEIIDSHIQFTMKYHMIHTDMRLAFPPSFARNLSSNETITSLFWDDNFTFAETQIHGVENLYNSLSQFVESRYKYPWHQLWLQSSKVYFQRYKKGLLRSLTK